MTQALHELWESALGRLSSKVSPQNYDMWLRPIEFVSDDAGTLQLRAPNSYVRLWFESNYLEAILDEIRTVSGVPIRVEFAADEAHRGPPIASIVVEDSTPAPAAAPPAPVEVDSLRSATLNPRYTFDTFVAGPSNQLAFAASQAAASAYPPKYNPVFICGGVGLGKTHLLHAIGHTQLGLRPNARIAYISSERFMNEYVNAIRAGKMQEFRTRYREGVDVLLVDDVQFLAGKDGTQDEFFHTFNALHDNHKQIVLTADRKPHEIADIADRLRTRFAWGLLADIEPPELEVRIAILRKKAAVEAIPLPDDVALFIASSIKSNVRELEGALIRLAAYASLSKREIDLPFAHETLGGALARPREHITVETVIKAVAAYYGVKGSDLKSPRRHRSIAGPRAVAMYLARQHTKDSYPDLGRAFGGKHHTTIISAVEKIVARLPDDPGLRGEIHAIEATLLR
ncbi:MAG: chromosomal replication initiator protein DnaA [Myxococcales bacterium]|nr:chromosomal replication initiator protein DnaA [Myxococcales bacterium]MBK7191854.1 chromosomal replication initiator protein DnaA [Myxococcales bacterium]